MNEYIWEPIDPYDEGKIEKFWEFCDGYFREILEDKPEDLKYFLGRGYRRTILRLMKRRVRPVTMLALYDDYGRIIAIAIYVLLSDNSAFIMEYAVDKFYRGHKLGKVMFDQLQDTVADQGAREIDLTCATVTAVKFWSKMGFLPTEDRTEQGDIIYRKTLD